MRPPSRVAPVFCSSTLIWLRTVSRGTFRRSAIDLGRREVICEKGQRDFSTDRACPPRTSPGRKSDAIPQQERDHQLANKPP